MKTFANWVALLLVATAHAFCFIYAWAFFGSSLGFSVLGATNSFLASLIAGALATALVSTAPLGMIIGFVSGKRFLPAAISLFPSVWLAFQIYFHGLGVAQRPASISLLIELLVISVVAAAFLLLGSRATSHRAAA